MRKPKPFISVVITVVLLTISAGCGTNSPSPTVMPTPSSTAVPTSTLKPTVTPTPTPIPTETPTPIAETDLQPASMEAITQTYREVEINLSIITDGSLDSFNPSIHRIYLNPRFNNSKGENSQEAFAHFITLAFYKLWQSRRNADPAAADVDFESYLELWNKS